MGRAYAPDGFMYQCCVPNCAALRRDRYEMSRHFNFVHQNTEKPADFPSENHLVGSNRISNQNDQRTAPSTNENKRKQQSNRTDESDSDEQNDAENTENRSRTFLKRRRTSEFNKRSSFDNNSHVDDLVVQLDKSLQIPKNELETGNVVRWRCYVCNNLFTAPNSVLRHYREKHSSLLEDYQPGRVAKILCDRSSGKPVRLVASREKQTPSLIGISPEVRGLILKELLVASQHPLEHIPDLCYDLLNVSSKIRSEAKDVLNRYNFVIEIVIEYQGTSTDVVLEQELCNAFSAVIDMSKTKTFLKPSLTLKLGIAGTLQDHVPAVSRQTTLFVPYNEGTFPAFVICIQSKVLRLKFLSVDFLPQANNRIHSYARREIFTFLSCLSMVKRTIIRGWGNEHEAAAFKQQTEAILDNRGSVLQRHRFVLEESQILYAKDAYTKAVVMSTFGFMMSCFPHNLDHPWNNAAKELQCRLALQTCKALNELSVKGIAFGKIEPMSSAYTCQSVTFWADQAFGFCGINDAHRGATHLARSVARQNMADYLSLSTTANANETEIVLLRSGARLDLAFALKLLPEKAAMIREQVRRLNGLLGNELARYDIKCIKLKFIGSDLSWEGDPRLIEVWTKQQMRSYPRLIQRPLGWD